MYQTSVSGTDQRLQSLGSVYNDLLKYRIQNCSSDLTKSDFWNETHGLRMDYVLLNLEPLAVAAIIAAVAWQSDIPLPPGRCKIEY